MIQTRKCPRVANPTWQKCYHRRSRSILRQRRPIAEGYFHIRRLERTGELLCDGAVGAISADQHFSRPFAAISVAKGPALRRSRYSARSNFCKHYLRARGSCAFAQVRIKSHARVDCERFVELHMQALTRWRVHVQLINGTANSA